MQRRSSGVGRDESFEWYTPRPRLWAIAAVGVLLTALFSWFFLSVLLFAHPSWSLPWGLVLAFLAVIPVALGFMTIRFFLSVFRWRPLLRFDRQGFECSKGRVLWEDMEEVSFLDRLTGGGDAGPTTETWVGFTLRPGNKVGRPVFCYDGMGGRLVADRGDGRSGLEVPVHPTDVATTFVPMLHRFYFGPIVGDQHWREIATARRNPAPLQDDPRRRG
jgi:hypothetical protein